MVTDIRRPSPPSTWIFVAFLLTAGTLSRPVTEAARGEESPNVTPVIMGELAATVPLNGAAKLNDQRFPSGHVIWDGRYVRAPYSVALQGETVLLNGQALPPLSPNTWLNDRGSRRRREVEAPLELIQIALDRGGLIVIESDVTHLIREENADLVLTYLSSNKEAESKLATLTDMFANMPGSGRLVNWQHIVSTFEPDVMLLDTYGEQSVYSDAFDLESPISFSSGTFRYCLTVSGMGLGVVAFGMLLQHRPHVRGPRVQVDRDGDGYFMLPYYVGLVVLFAGFDLVCTLFTHGSGGLLELNPAGSSLLAAPWALAVVKSIATFLSAWILLSLRKYRFAQTAAWWMCLLCVFVTMRWVTFNSMFMT